MTPHPHEISFDNTEHAFAYKSNASLKRARLLFSTMSKGWLVQLGTRLTPWAIRAGLPVKRLIRSTIFGQFVGGETLEETSLVSDMLEKFNVQVILDYGVEGKEGEANFEHACEEFIRVINYAAEQVNIPLISIKVTGFASFALLEKLHASQLTNRSTEGILSLEALTEEEKNAWERVKVRMERIIAIAAMKQVGVLVDAEESWIQDPVDALTMQMMEKYNRQKGIVYNTIQLYRHDRLKFLKACHEQCVQKKFTLGAKLVRGAYMEKERARASSMNYPSPIQPNKEATDTDYNLAIKFCIDHMNEFSLIVASHNEKSNLYATRLLIEGGYPLSQPNIHFSQLFGMSDNITFNLADAGCSVSKYLPFGPIKDVVPYLMRRAQENSSVKGQTGRELGLIEKELSRRGK
ncbi:MAG: proline dehydrogenase family protein [Chitinophagaceae bacterium]